MSFAGLPLPSDSLVVRTFKSGFARLRFEQPLEGEFWQAHDASAQPRVRIAVLLALATVLGFALMDHWVLGQPWRVPQDLVRFGIQLPIVIAAIYFTSQRYYRSHYLPVIRICAPIFGIGSVIMSVGGTSEEIALISTRLILVTFFFYFMLGLSFYEALRSNAIVVAAYGVALIVGSIPTDVGIYHLFVMLCANLFAGAGCYALEHANRLAFLERRMLTEVATHDGLTGLLNRGTLDVRLRTVWENAARQRESLAVIMIDIDHFKGYNDHYGHQAGDECLRQIAKAVRDCARRPLDIVARYGGEEFMVVLPGADREHGEKVARALVAAVSDLRISHVAAPGQPFVTASVGTATVNAGMGLSYEAAIRVADRALYMAKEQGRNRAVVLDRMPLPAGADRPSIVAVR